MNLSIRVLGWELLAIVTDHPEAVEVCTDEPGDCTTHPVGFTARPELPDEVGLPDRG